MAQFHFVTDYENLVLSLLRNYPLDEAMSCAVGGEYETIGAIEAQLLSDVGLKDGMSLVDLGCGSGRAAFALGKLLEISYTGIDIVQPLLDYAKSRSPADYNFVLHRELSIPLPSGSADMLCAFSVFTHLLHTETYIYLEEAVRVLRPKGTIVFSFLEYAVDSHWEQFIGTKNAQLKKTVPHLNMFIDRTAIETWAAHLGLRVDRYISSDEPIWRGHSLGQSVVVLRKG